MLPIRLRLAQLVLPWILVSPAAAGAAEAPRRAPSPTQARQFESRVAPILARHCLGCHGPTTRQGGLDLSTAATALAGGARGKVIVPGKPETSRLWKRIAADEMPPKEPLSAADKGVLRQWLTDGAAWGKGTLDPAAMTTDRRAGTDWWSLQPIQRPAPPKSRQSGWGVNPIDAFVQVDLERAGLKPSPPADRVTLLRRVYFDMLGLPPTPAEVDAFVKDAAPGAYERLIDRVLASPHYGERWARHWLDVVRFGESQGFERNKLRPNAWKYRDWVVEAFNSDLPYDEFVKLQVAGDVLRPDDPLAVIASGFLVAGPYDLTSYTDGSPMMRAAAREEELEGLVGTVSQTFLGLTVNCARCHDHKFDPVSQREYYQIAAALGGTYHGDERNALSAAGRADAERERQELLREAAALRKEADAPPNGQSGERERLAAEASRKESRARLLEGGPAHVSRPRPVGPFHVLDRGDPRHPREPVSPAGLASLAGLSPDWRLDPEPTEGERRQALAAWLTHPANPLTPRVIVNRIWSYHFGAGLVAAPNDFGFNGGRPSHPELLDWLAATFSLPPNRSGAASGSASGCGGSLKKLHRLILLSATYRQASRPTRSGMAKDVENRLLWRQNPRRLEAEAYRDAVLAVSGRLDRTLGGPGFRDWTVRSQGNNEIYTVFDGVGPEFNRRTLYRMVVRAGTDPLLDVLDCPDPSVATPRRTVTTTPLQALSLLHSGFMERNARQWAERLERETPGEGERVALAYRLAFGREARPDELELGRRFAAEHGLAQLCLVLLNTNEFAFID